MEEFRLTALIVNHGLIFRRFAALALWELILIQYVPSALGIEDKGNSADLVTTNATLMEETVVKAAGEHALGAASSASEGVITASAIQDRPLLRTGEILETIPGVVITQHAGGGKANQYFLRGFNLDHGTDIAIDLDGMPVNLASHAHAPGYSDLNIAIPELVDSIGFEKGPYYAANGDFSSAGAAHIAFVKRLPECLVDIEQGMYGYARIMSAYSWKVSTGDFLYGIEAYHDDGPWISRTITSVSTACSPTKEATRHGDSALLRAGIMENGIQQPKSPRVRLKPI
jgi:outer membrane cobalamin receptor